MNFCLFTMHSSRIQPLVDITLPNKQEYCTRNGYALGYELCSWEFPPGWERLRYLKGLAALSVFDYVFWLGPDCLVTNMNTRLESLVGGNPGLVIAYDAVQNQADSFLLRCCPESVGIMDRLIRSYAQYWTHPLAEQQALEELIPSIREHVKIVPQWVMNSYLYDNYRQRDRRYAAGRDMFGNDGEWQPGHFVFHCPGIPMEAKLQNLQRIAPQVIR